MEICIFMEENKKYKLFLINANIYKLSKEMPKLIRQNANSTILDAIVFFARQIMQYEFSNWFINVVSTSGGGER